MRWVAEEHDTRTDASTADDLQHRLSRETHAVLRLIVCLYVQRRKTAAKDAYKLTLRCLSTFDGASAEVPIWIHICLYCAVVFISCRRQIAAAEWPVLHIESRALLFNMSWEMPMISCCVICCNCASCCQRQRCCCDDCWVSLSSFAM